MSALPDDILIQDRVWGTIYWFSRRPTSLRLMALVLLAGGGFAVWYGQGRIRSAIPAVQQVQGIADLAALLALLFGCVLAVGGAGLIGFALYFMVGRRGIALRANRLRALRRLGPIMWWRSIQLDEISRLVVADPYRMFSGQSADSKWLDRNFGGVHVLFAVGEAGRLIRLSGMRGGAWLGALAAELSSRIDDFRPELAPPPVVELEGWLRSEPPGATLESLLRLQPVDSPVQVEREADGLTLLVPSPGLFSRKSHGWFVFGLLWMAVVAALTAGYVAILLSLPWSGGPPLWMLVGVAGIGGVVLAVFWAAGVAMVLGGFHLGRRHAVIELVGGRFHYAQKGLGPMGGHDLARADIAWIATKQSDTSYDTKFLYELVVQPVEGEPIRLLRSRPGSELYWMAAVIRKGLDVPAG